MTLSLALLLLLLVGASAQQQQFVDQETASLLAKQSFDQFVSQILQQLDEVSSSQALSTTSDDEIEVNVSSTSSELSEPDTCRLDAMATILISLERSIMRGSLFFNAGQPELCARLYFQTVQQVAAVLREMGEEQAAGYLTQVLARATQIASASDAAWLLRRGMEQFVAVVQQAPSYAALFEQSVSEAIDQVRVQADAGCAYGLVFERVPGTGAVRISEVRSDDECDDELEQEDAIFFVVEQESDDEEELEAVESSSSDVILFTIEFDIQLVDNLALPGGMPSSNNNKPVADFVDDMPSVQQQQQQHTMLPQFGTWEALFVAMICAMIVMEVLRRRVLARRRAAAAAAAAQQRVFAAPAAPAPYTGYPGNAAKHFGGPAALNQPFAHFV